MNDTHGAPLLEVEGLKKHYPVRGGVLSRTVGTVRADVAVSDRAVPRSSISTSLEPVRAGQTAVRVRTSIRITEPIVTIDLTVGCVSQVARRFVVFADPVALGATPAAAAAVEG